MAPRNRKKKKRRGAAPHDGERSERDGRKRKETAFRPGRGNDPQCQNEGGEALRQGLQRHEHAADPLRPARARHQFGRNRDHAAFGKPGQKAHDQQRFRGLRDRGRIVQQR